MLRRFVAKWLLCRRGRCVLLMGLESADENVREGVSHPLHYARQKRGGAPVGSRTRWEKRSSGGAADLWAWARGGVFVRTARRSRGRARDAVSWWDMVERRRGKDGIRGAGVSADNASGDGGARLGSGGFCVRVGRRVRRPSLVRNGHYHAAFRGARLPRGRDRAARLERSGVGCGVRRAASGVPRLGRQHGLDGEPLHGGEEAPPRRCVLAGR